MPPHKSASARRWVLLGLLALLTLYVLGLAQPGLAQNATRTPTLTPGPNNYVVQFGDTLLKLARRFGVTLDALMVANRLSSETIYVGQVLRIPTATPTRVLPTLTAGAFYYTVQAGDQLLRLARQFGVTTSAIRSANRMASDTVYTGQVLVIPAPVPTRTPFPPDRTYVVQPGDQLLALARRFGVTLDLLKSANGLRSDTIQPGQVLFIPTPPPNTATPTALPANTVLYVVKVGDRLARLAARYGVTIDAIKNANRLRTETIYIGQQLLISNPTLNPVAYVVQRGDTLTSLAQKFGTTVEQIKAANGLQEDTIVAGWTLLIPVPIR
jgi:LysM repeat protein